RCAERGAQCAYSDGPNGRGRGHWRRCRLSCVKGSGLRDRPDAACEWRDGNVFVSSAYRNFKAIYPQILPPLRSVTLPRVAPALRVTFLATCAFGRFRL